MKKEEIGLKTPDTNRGVRNTYQSTLISSVDWFSCTFKNVKDWREVCGVLCLDSTDFVEHEKGRNGYKKSAIYGAISIFFDGTTEMGIFLDLSGQGCREYEQTFKRTGFSWQSFFKYLLGFEINVTRLDLAIDDINNQFFTLKQIENKIRTACVVSRFKTSRNFEEYLLETGETLGQTIYFGKSNVMIRFYDKLEERESKFYALENNINFWVRTELQIRKERAMKACRVISDGGDLGSYICGILRNYLTFKVKGTDKNRSRWNDCGWWLKFLGNAEKLKLTEVHPYPSIIRKKNWIDTQVVSSLATIYEALDNDDIFFDYLKLLGKSRMSDDHVKLANEFKVNELSKQMLKNEMQSAIKKLSEFESIESLTEFWYKHEISRGVFETNKQEEN